MPDKTIKHFVFIRFFSYQDPKYPYDIFNLDFLSKQLNLATNHVLKSLENQTNKNFEIDFMMHENFFSDKKYEFIFTTLKNATTLPVRFIKIPQTKKVSEGGSFSFYDESEIPILLKKALNEYDFVIQSRIDFDDFIFKDAVADTQSKVNECDNILVYGYCKGYIYVLGEFYVHNWRWRGTGHNGIFQSVILKSSSVKKIPLIIINKFYHDIFKTMLKNFLEKKGIEFSESMFQQNTSINAYIYFRHELSHWISYHNKALSEITDGLKLADDITKEKLAEEFGFYLDVKLSKPYIDFYPDTKLSKHDITSRVDIKLMSDKGGFQILSVSDDKANVWKPAWFQKDGIGYQIQSNAGNMKIVAKATTDGKISLNLRGIDVRTPEDKSKRVPYWVDYTKLAINGKVILDKLTPAWHDKPFRYNMDVKANEEILLQVEWLPHKKTIKHFVFSRFFNFEDPKYPHDIYDVVFLTKQLLLAQNMLKSLENQTNKNFDLVFIVNPKFFDNPKYEFIFQALQYATTLPLKFIKMNELPSLVKDAYEKYDFVIQSRMDFDDFIFKDAIADTQNKVNECDKILAYGYCKGCTYIYEKLYIQEILWVYDVNDGPTGHHSILQSLIWKSSFAKNLPFFGVYGGNHGKIKLRIKEFLEKNGLEFSENMFQQNVSDMAYIYFRHEDSHWILTHNDGKPNIKAPNRSCLTTKDITKKQLEEEFGFHLKLNSIE